MAAPFTKSSTNTDKMSDQVGIVIDKRTRKTPLKQDENDLDDQNDEEVKMSYEL